MEASGLEFFVNGAHELWMRNGENESRKFLPGEVETTRMMAELIKAVYPDVYKVLEKNYSKYKGNPMNYRYKIVSRFVRCNMSEDDMGKFDVVGGKLNLEQTRCPLKGSGDCPFENVVCNPKANGLSAKEKDVVMLYSQGFSLQKIADMLGKRLGTVKAQLDRIRVRYGLKRTRDVVMLAYLLNLI